MIKPFFFYMFAGALIVANFQLYGQGNEPSLKEGYYLTVGTFSVKNNAVNFSEELVEKGIQASYGFLSSAGYYYVYLNEFKTKKNAFILAPYMQEETKINDTWVLKVGDPPLVVESSLVKKEANTSPNPVQIEVANAEVETKTVSPEPVAAVVPQAKEEKEVVEVKEGQFKIVVNAFNNFTEEKVSGKIELNDPKRLKNISVLETNKELIISDPKNGSAEIQLVSNIFGYSKDQHDIDLDDPDLNSHPFVDVNDDVITVNFPLRRMEKGDINTMYNVFFFKDAAIMRPESRLEVNSLFEMMEENANTKIKIHGHTNGNAAGNIIILEDDPKDFFSLSYAGKEKKGSAKELSLQRSEVIKKYLISKGIDKNRMDTKGWGGKEMIYDKFDRAASKNVRVEIEIL